MSKWSLLTNGNSSWDDLIFGRSDTTYLHSSEWARHMESQGWITCRWECCKDDQIVSLMQGFLKKYPFNVGILWFPDWMLGDHVIDENLGKKIQNSLGLKFVYIRIRSHNEMNDLDCSILLKSGFLRPRKSFNSGETMHLNLALSKDSMHKGLRKNWKRNLKRSSRVEYDISEITKPNVVIDIYHELCNIKKLDTLLTNSEINSLYSAFQDNLIVIGATTPDGVVHAIRGAIVMNNKATDIFAASNSYSRKHYLSYALCWKLLLKCKEIGCVDYNLNGIDPIKNTGVYNFKKGTGAMHKKIVGEYEWSSNRMLSWAVSVISSK